MTRLKPISECSRTQADRERALLAAGWFEPVQLACDADRFGLHISDFRDRLCGVVAVYLRDCGESGRTPTLTGAEAVLNSFAVPREADELFFLLIDTAVSDRDSFADLIRDVLREADDRSEQLCRELTRDAWRAMVRGLKCPHCRAEHDAKRRSAIDRPQTRRVVYA